MLSAIVLSILRLCNTIGIIFLDLAVYKKKTVNRKLLISELSVLIAGL